LQRPGLALLPSEFCSVPNLHDQSAPCVRNRSQKLVFVCERIIQNIPGICLESLATPFPQAAIELLLGEDSPIDQVAAQNGCVFPLADGQPCCKYPLKDFLLADRDELGPRYLPRLH